MPAEVVEVYCDLVFVVGSVLVGTLAYAVFVALVLSELVGVRKSW